MTYRTEFPDFEMDVDIPAKWVDVSWHNDACPSFEPTPGLRVWVDYADRERSEFPNAPRFSVARYDDEMNFILSLLETDDWEAVLPFVEAIRTLVSA